MSLRIASEHDDDFPKIDDRHSVALVAALAKMQNGRNYYDQAAVKLEILLGTNGLLKRSVSPSDVTEFEDRDAPVMPKEIRSVADRKDMPGVSSHETRLGVTLRPKYSDNANESPSDSFENDAEKADRQVSNSSGEHSCNSQPTQKPTANSKVKRASSGLESTVEEDNNNSSNTELINLGVFGTHSSTIDHDKSSPSLGKRSSTPFGSLTVRISRVASDTRKDTEMQGRVRKFLDRITVQLFSVSVILFTFALICFDTDARAKGSSAERWVNIALFVCFLIYICEFLATIFVQRFASVHSQWNYTDAFVIATSSIEYVIAWNRIEGLSLLRLLRICRLFRLGRVIRALRLLRSVQSLKEQYLLMMMMASCVRTVGWAFLFCFFIMTVWSILAVEFLNDIVERLDSSSPIWKDCDRCGRSFNSVWESTLTFMQTIVAGDSWGMVALPVIEDSWWSLFIFVGALSTVVFGVLNMISVVVIDTFAERRAKDLTHVATELEYEEIEERRKLRKIFRKVDADGSGALSLQELQKGAQKVKEFRQYLRVLDIDDNDLNNLFTMIDIDCSGEIDPDEFIEALYRMKSTESKTATRFVKHMVDNLLERTQGLDERLENIQSQVTAKLQHVEQQIKLEYEGQRDGGELQDVFDSHVDEINSTVARAVEKAVSAAVASAATKASHVIQEVVTASSNQVIAMNERLTKSELGDDPALLQRCKPPSTPKERPIGPASGNAIVISAASKVPPPAEWFD